MNTKAPARAAARRTRPLQYKTQEGTWSVQLLNITRKASILVPFCGRGGRRLSANADIAGHLAGHSTASFCRRVRHGGRPRATPSPSRSPCRRHAGSDNGIRATASVGRLATVAATGTAATGATDLGVSGMGVSVSAEGVAGCAGAAAPPAPPSAATPEAVLATSLIARKRPKRGWPSPAISAEGEG